MPQHAAMVSHSARYGISLSSLSDSVILFRYLFRIIHLNLDILVVIAEPFSKQRHTADMLGPILHADAERKDIPVNVDVRDCFVGYQVSVHIGPVVGNQQFFQQTILVDIMGPPLRRVFALPVSIVSGACPIAQILLV